MVLKEIKKVAKLLNLMSEYEDVHEIVSYLLNDSGFTEAQVLEMGDDIRENVNLFLFEIIQETISIKGSKKIVGRLDDVNKYIN